MSNMTFEKRENLALRLFFVAACLLSLSVFFVLACIGLGFDPGRLMLIPFMAALLIAFVALIFSAPRGFIFKD